MVKNRRSRFLATLGMTSGWQLRDILEAARLILSAESVVLIARFFASREEKQILRSAQDDSAGWKVEFVA